MSEIAQADREWIRGFKAGREAGLIEAAQAERDAVVRWLRENNDADDCGGGDRAHWIAQAIEAREHLGG